ncbi:MAG: XisI protein [Nostoc sp. DedQUE12b]|uniref:XisI protein n=1 Tax=Nostoc sp. DedQUE12b TaxID=3075398 RepID=UPI002AD3E4A8|nr:XisI protein [Nostoc sp. DedQUE12b]MDZ8087968.1 XisI protein [Nostoc sp. DedQUE12b]
MDKLAKYRQIIQQVLTIHAQIKPAYGEIERQTIFDVQQNHYQVVNTGWENRCRVYGCLIHLDIRDGKIWIQYDGTEIGVANELIEYGIPKQDIVLAYQPPYMRKLTEFAVG